MHSGWDIFQTSALYCTMQLENYSSRWPFYMNNIKMKYSSYAFHPQFDNQPICNLELRKCHLYFGSPPPHYYVGPPSETFCQDSVSSSVLPSCFVPRKLSVHHVLSMATNYIKSNLSEFMYLILEFVRLYQIYF